MGSLLKGLFALKVKKTFLPDSVADLKKTNPRAHADESGAEGMHSCGLRGRRRRAIFSPFFLPTNYKASR